MKRKNNLFEKITDPDNIRIAHKNSRKGKTGYREVKHCSGKRLWRKVIKQKRARRNK